MRNVIAAINMTVDGFCDHTAVEPDDEVHQYYTDLLNDAGVILYGRITFQLMEFWRSLAESPSGRKAMDDFATVMNRIPKVVFSRTIEAIDWHSARLANLPIEDEVSELKKQPGKDIYVGSRSLMVQLINLGLLDELQLMIHPVIARGRLPLFDGINERTTLKVKKIRSFSCGSVVFHYEPPNLRN